MNKPTHVVLIGKYNIEANFRTVFSIPCFSENEATEICNKYQDNEWIKANLDVIIVKYNQ
jgi:hypothetical protein